MDTNNALQKLNDSINSTSTKLVIRDLCIFTQVYIRVSLGKIGLMRALLVFDQKEDALQGFENALNGLKQRMNLEIFEDENAIKDDAADVFRLIGAKHDWSDEMILEGLVNSMRSTINSLAFFAHSLNISIKPDLQTHTLQLIQDTNSLKYVIQTVSGLLYP